MRICSYLYVLYVNLYANTKHMAITYKATFRPEKRNDKKTGELIECNVPLLLDLSCKGRTWFNTGIRLQHINDFDVNTQKMCSGKKALINKELSTATRVNEILNYIRSILSEAFSSAMITKQDINAKYLIGKLNIAIHGESEEVQKNTLIDEFYNVYSNWINRGIISESRGKQYKVCHGMLKRFLAVSKMSDMSAIDFDSTQVIKFRDFLFNEHKITEKHPLVYSGMQLRELPKPRTQNTISVKLKMLKTVFSEFEEKDIISINPFRKIPKKERTVMLKESYDEPIYLTLQELKVIINNECSSDLERVRDCFLLQCAIGCRVEDFNSLTWNNVIVKDEFCYVHYVPSKTSHRVDLKPIDTPLVKFAYDILIKYKDKLSGLLCPYYLGNVNGKLGYNKKIKELLKHYEINRPVVIRKDGSLVSVPLHKISSSKICRKTHIDIITKVSLNKYSSGLHKEGSKEVERYTGFTIEEKYKLYCIAFGQEGYEIKGE